MIPVAAFAITVTSASAFSGDMLQKLDADLSESQFSALKEARELRVDGAERAEVRAVLKAGGVDKDTMREIHRAMKELRAEHRVAVKATIEAEDYEVFQAVVADGPLSDKIESAADFALLVEAYDLREAGDMAAAKEIMTDLGFEKPEGKRGGVRGERFGDRFGNRADRS